MSRVPRSHGNRPPGPLAPASAATPDPRTTARSTILGRSEATLTTAAAPTSSALACAGFSRRRHRSARPNHQPATGASYAIQLETSWKRSRPRPSLASAHSIGLRSVGFDGDRDSAALDLDRDQCAEAQLVVRHGCPERIAGRAQFVAVAVSSSIRLSRKNLSHHNFGSHAVRYMDFTMWRAVGGPVTGESAKSFCVDAITALRQFRKRSPSSSQSTSRSRSSSSSPV